MAIARTILGVLIALSVAMLPVAGAAAFKLKSQNTAEVSASEPMRDCCPAKPNACDKDDCGSMATCAMKCFKYSAGIPSPLAYSFTSEDVMPLFESIGFNSQIGSAPFRPPRL
jgi:hypothetical protein